QHGGERQAQKRLGVSPQPRPAESPALPDAEGEPAEGAEGQEEADDIGKSPPHFEQRERDARNDLLEPVNDGHHGCLVSPALHRRRTDFKEVCTPLFFTSHSAPSGPFPLGFWSACGFQRSGILSCRGTGAGGLETLPQIGSNPPV